MNNYKPFIYVSRPEEEEQYNIQVLVPLPEDKHIEEVYPLAGENENPDRLTIKVVDGERGETNPVESSNFFYGEEGQLVVVTVVDGGEVKGRSVAHYDDADDKSDGIIIIQEPEL